MIYPTTGSQFIRYLPKLSNVFVQIAKCICPMLTGERFPQRWQMIYIPPLGHLIIVTWAARRHNGTRVGLTTMQWYKGGEVLRPNLWRLESSDFCSLIGFDGKATCPSMSFGVFQPSSGSINSVAGSERNNWESWFIRGDYQVGNAIRSWLHLSAIIWELEGSRDTNSIRIQCILFHHIAKDNKLMLQNRKKQVSKFTMSVMCRYLPLLNEMR